MNKSILKTISAAVTFLSGFFFLWCGAVFAQVPDIEWARCYGGTSPESARYIRQTADGGYIVVGNSGSDDGDVHKNYGGTDCWIVKLNSSGDTVWTRVLGGTQHEYATSVQQTTDGGYIVTAQSRSHDGDFTGGSTNNYKCWIIKLDDTGGVQWKKRFGGSGGDTPRDIRQTADNGYIVAVISSSNNGHAWGNHGGLDYWIIKLNNSGDTLWTKSLGGTGDDQAFSIQQTTDNGYIVAGQSASNNGDVSGNHGGIDFWVVKLNGSGDTLWTKSLGGTEDDYGHAIQQTADGGYIVGGCSQSNNGDVTGHHGDSTKADIWIVKLNGTGDIQWQKSLGGTDQEALYATLLAFSLQQTADGGYIVASYSMSNDGDVSGNNGSSDVWLVKLTDTGNIEWQKSLGGTGTDRAFSVRQTTDGGYVVAGIAGTNSGDVSGNHGSGDFWVIKLSATTGIAEQANHFFKVYPNPANSFLNIQADEPIETVSIYNTLGARVQTETRNSFSIAQLPSGLYLLHIKTKKGVGAVRVMKE